MFFFMIYVFTPKRINPDCSFKSNQKQVKISILTPRCAICLHGVFHTDEIISVCPEIISAIFCTSRSVLPSAEMISAVGCTPQRSSPWVLQTVEIVSAVCCTPQRQFCDRISRRNQNRIRKYFSLFIRGPDEFQL